MRNSRLVLSPLLAFAAWAALAPDAWSAQQVYLPAIAGRAALPNEAFCFPQVGMASVYNSCNGNAKTFLVPVVNNFTAGLKSFIAEAPAPIPGQIDLSAPSCTARVANKSETAVWAGNPTNVNGQTFLGQLSATPSDTLSISCQLDQIDRRLNSVGILQ